VATLEILALCGSLRQRSSNSELLQACALLAPPDLRLEFYRGLTTLPYFNADLDGASPPPPVAAWRAQVARADALLISSPEYARGVPGVLKNALDWLVGGSEVVGKPVALLNGSPRSRHAQDSLTLTLQTISARPVSPQAFLAPVLGRTLAAADIAADGALSAVLRAALVALTRAARAPATHGDAGDLQQ
jgi:chromate reductase, NAD(P)H dehydrogenase (quinone)